MVASPWRYWVEDWEKMGSASAISEVVWMAGLGVTVVNAMQQLSAKIRTWVLSENSQKNSWANMEMTPGELQLICGKV